VASERPSFASNSRIPVLSRIRFRVIWERCGEDFVDCASAVEDEKEGRVRRRWRSSKRESVWVDREVSLGRDIVLAFALAVNKREMRSELAVRSGTS
jgi:hypothetical protein